jgi:hypothetical protein
MVSKKVHFHHSLGGTWLDVKVILKYYLIKVLSRIFLAA